MGSIPPPPPRPRKYSSYDTVIKSMEAEMSTRIAALEETVNGMAYRAGKSTDRMMKEIEQEIDEARELISERQVIIDDMDPPPPPPKPPLGRVMVERLDASSTPCEICGSSTKYNWKLQTVGCFQDECENYYKTNLEKAKKEKEEIKTVDILPKSKYDL